MVRDWSDMKWGIIFYRLVLSQPGNVWEQNTDGRARYNWFPSGETDWLCSREFQSEVLVILTEYSTARTCWEEFVTGNFAQLVNIQS